MLRREMEETRKRKVSAGSLNQVKRHHFDTTISRNLCTKASPIDFHGVSLDDDALTEILVRLPVKPLFRFKSVCKSWFSIISSDYFRLRKRPTSLIYTALMRDRDPWSSMDIIERSELFYSNQIIERSSVKQRIHVPFDDNVLALSCCWSCCSNGLVLLRNRFNNEYSYSVYNPTTNRSDTIPLPDYEPLYGPFHLVFDPFKSPYYKIVCIREDPLQIEVFNSESGRWSVCVEGFTNGKSLFYLLHRGTLYCINIVKNVWQFMVCPLPKLADEGPVHYDILQEWNGCLYYCAFVGGHAFKSRAAVLWEMQVDVDDPRRPKWLLKYQDRDPRCSPAYMVAFIAETSTVLVHAPRNEMIMAYSFLDKTYKELFHLEPSIDYNLHVNHFGETLP